MTNTANKKKSFLIVDSDEPLLTALKGDPATKRYPIISPETGTQFDVGKAAQLIIADKTQPLYAVFVNPEVTRDSGISVIRATMSHRPAVSVYVIYDPEMKQSLLPEEDLKRVGVRGIFPKPFTHKELMDRAGIFTFSFDAQKTVEKAEGSSAEAVGVEINRDDEGYASIRADDFVSGNKSLFDLFVRLRAGKYVKLLQAGDVFTPDRLKSYLDKGTTHFYIKKEVQAEYLGYCDTLVGALLKQKTISSEVKVSQTLNQGEETMKFLKDNGLSEESVGYAASFIGNVRTLTTQLEVGTKTSAMKNFMDNLALYDHGAGTAMLSAVLARSLDITMEKPVEIVGIASIFHDISMSQMPQEIWHEDESIMKPEEQKLFRMHPMASADILRKLGNIHPTAIQAVEQHHMRAQGQGFPERTGANQQGMVGEIVGICSEFNHYIKKGEKDPAFNVLKEFETKMLPLFSRKLVAAFRAAFMKQSS